MKLPKVTLKSEFWKEDDPIVWKKRFLKYANVVFIINLSNFAYFVYRYPHYWIFLFINLSVLLLIILMYFTESKEKKKNETK